MRYGGIANALFNPLKKGFDSLFFPQTCVCCEAWHEASLPWLCEACQEKIRRSLSPSESKIELSENHSLTVRTYWKYEEPMEQVIHAFKYDAHPSIGLWLGEILGEKIPSQTPKAPPKMIIPVPIHRKRLKKRGFNQSMMLAKGLLKRASDIEIGEPLKRSKNTPSQTQLSKTEREENVKNAFALRRGSARSIQGKSIILIDDVLTTGSTMRECASVLLQAGAASVEGVTVARSSSNM